MTLLLLVKTGGVESFSRKCFTNNFLNLSWSRLLLYEEKWFTWELKVTRLRADIGELVSVAKR